MAFSRHKSLGKALSFFLSGPPSEAQELVVFSHATSSIHVLHGVSVFIWLALEQGFNAETIESLYRQSTANHSLNPMFSNELKQLQRLFHEGA